LLEVQASAALQLEDLVRARTGELEAANEELRTQMTERARIKDSLRQAQKIEALGQLTGGVAHDFNNLLMVILGGLEMLDHTDQRARRQMLMDGMRQAAQRGAALTRQLLAFSRRQTLQPQPVNLAHQIGSMRELLDRSLGGNVHVQVDFAADLWAVQVDPGELELVVLNLAVNARDAMPKGGAITIRAQNISERNDHHLRGDYVRLSIMDAGTGMSAEVQEHVFEPFFTTKEVGKGSGLGLAQVYGFAKQSGGAVHIESEVGKGTTVSLLLPRSTARPASDAAAVANLPTQSKADEPAGRVLLVEDDDDVASMAGEMLGQLGYEVTRVASASAALGALANGRRIDVIFSDIMMPGEMDGVELGREVRERGGDIPVLLTSGYAEAATPRAESEGFDVLRKPYSLSELAAALKTIKQNTARS
jgi:signal transduction histidine kinase/CheY-like chemotaxis protein